MEDEVIWHHHMLYMPLEPCACRLVCASISTGGRPTTRLLAEGA